MTPIAPDQVRYIKLGKAGLWEEECIQKHIVRFSFGSASPDRFPLCESRRWNDLIQSFLKEGKNRGTATNFANQTRRFFEDDGSTLWITFVGEELY